MFKIHEIALALVALALVVAALFYGLFHVTLGGVAVVALVLVIGTLIGIGLGRNSKMANAIYDRTRAEADEAIARTAAFRKTHGV